MKRLSYSDRLLLALFLVIALAIAGYSSYFVFDRAYTLAVKYVEVGHDYVSDEVWYVNVARRYLKELFRVEMDYMPYSSKISEGWLNPEHPPLGKYMIALSMLACGDKPICWRIPSIIEASLIPVILFLSYARRAPIALLAGSAAAAAAASDYILHRIGSVAMLDIHIAFFTSLAIFFVNRGKLLPALVMAGLALSVKYSGAALVGAIAFYYLLNKSISSRLRARIFAASILMPISVFLIVYSPLIYFKGVTWFIEEGVIKALAWHSTSRPPGGPPTSSPLEWIINGNPFFFSASKLIVAAELNTIIHALAIFSIIIVLPAYIANPNTKAFSSLLYVMTMAMYYTIYFMGNKTLYSFYAVQLTPAAAGAIAELILMAKNHAKTSQGRHDRQGE